MFGRLADRKHEGVAILFLMLSDESPRHCILFLMLGGAPLGLDRCTHVHLLLKSNLPQCKTLSVKA